MKMDVKISQNNQNVIQAYRFKLCCGICHEAQWWVDTQDDWMNVPLSGLILQTPAIKDSCDNPKY